MPTFTTLSSLLALSTLFISPLHAQLYNTGQLYIDSNTVLFVTDTLRNTAAGNLTNQGTILATGTIINNASINGKGKVILSGTSPQNLAGTGVISNLEVNTAGATVVPGNMQNITGTLMLTAGTLTANSGLTLKSTDSNTARVLPVTSGAVSGNVIVERYIPSRRAWRLITAPVSSANTIYEAWQNGGVNTPGIGTFITGPGGGNGLDNGKNYSLKTYDAVSQLLLPVTNTNQSLSSSSGSADNKGYFLFVRGDRNPSNLTPPNTNITTLSSKGHLLTGTQIFTASAIAGNFTLVGNPYASPSDFNLFSRTNVAKRFYAWDPSLNTVGGYVLVDDVDNDGQYSISPVSSQTKILQSSQAFFVQTASAGPASVTINEYSKSSFTSNAGFRAGDSSSEVLRTNLYLRNTDTAILADGALNEYNNNFSKVVNIEDGTKMENINESLSIERDGQLLAIERRPLVVAGDTLFLNLINTTSRNYRFSFEPENIPSVISAWLEDTYRKTTTPLNLSSSTNVDFSVAAGTPSGDAHRFRVVFKTSETLPLISINVKAYQQNAGIEIYWNLETENNINHYEVEKSGDGQVFTKMTTAQATQNNNAAASYTWFDTHPFTGNNFYRIKAAEKTGEIKYSQTVNIKIGKDKPDISVYPNPVLHKTINLQLNNQRKGTYTVELLNALGQQIFTRTIEHGGGSATQTIQLNSVVSKGVYQLHVSNGDNKINQQIVIE